MSDMIRAAHGSLRLIQSCHDRRQLPSIARPGRARAPVPTPVPVPALASMPARAGLIAARNRYAIRLIPSRVFSFYDGGRTIAAAFRPQRDDSSVELCRCTDNHRIAIGNLKRAQAVTLRIPVPKVFAF